MDPSATTTAAASGVALAASAAIGVIAIISLICWIKVLIALFKKEGAGLGILGILCGIYAFIWGWMKSGELGLKKTMIWWTLCLVASIALSILAPAAIMGIAASDPEFQKAFKEAQEEIQRQQEQPEAQPQQQ